MQRDANTTICSKDSGWSSVSTLTCQTLEQAEVTVIHATLEAGHAATLGPCTAEQACTVILHLSAIDLFELHEREVLLWSGRRTPGFVSVIAGPQAFSVTVSHRLEALVLRIPRSSLLRVAPELRTKRREKRKEAHASYDPVGHKLGLALLPAFRIAADPLPRSTTHLIRAMCYHFAFKYPWAQEKSVDAGPRGLAPWQALTAENLLERGELQVREVAAACQLSPRHFARLFRITFRRSPHTFLVERRVDGLKRLLLSSDVSLADAAVRVGFADQASMSRSFRHVVGASPGAWRTSQRHSPAKSLASP
jgi:AraC family transcriptional regulator